MDDNPFASPIAPGGNELTGATIQYRVFRGKSFSLSFSKEAFRADLRRKVQQAIDSEIGANNVVSIQEHTGELGGMSIVVWHRVRVD